MDKFPWFPIPDNLADLERLSRCMSSLPIEEIRSASAVIVNFEKDPPVVLIPGTVPTSALGVIAEAALQSAGPRATLTCYQKGEEVPTPSSTQSSEEKKDPRQDKKN